MCRSTSDSLCVLMSARLDSLVAPPWLPVFRMPLRMDLAVNPARSAFPKARSAFLCAKRNPTARESDLDVKQPGGRTRNLAAGHPGASRNGAASRAGSTAHHAAQRLPGRCVSTAFHPIRAEGAGWGFPGLPFTAQVRYLPSLQLSQRTRIGTYFPAPHTSRLATGPHRPLPYKDMK
ncbi:hypothetical protein BX589_11497 [Paraburkholderia fungorum]|jgi:hypothetical protein|nr:hypothetical protein BX589_11497 [Paraburkholderia fungorum]